MKKLDLVKHVATENGKIKRTIINALEETDPNSQITAQAISELFAEINELVQNANIKGTNKS